MRSVRYHMLWLVFVLLPILFTTLAYAVVLDSSAWSYVLAACSLSVLIPWVAALAFAWFVPLRIHERRWAAAVPFVYVAVLALGVAVGDTTGWVPQ
jgi:hypothetical protein